MEKLRSGLQRPHRLKEEVPEGQWITPQRSDANLLGMSGSQLGQLVPGKGPIRPAQLIHRAEEEGCDIPRYIQGYNDVSVEFTNEGKSLIKSDKRKNRLASSSYVALGITAVGFVGSVAINLLYFKPRDKEKRLPFKLSDKVDAAIVRKVNMEKMSKADVADYFGVKPEYVTERLNAWQNAQPGHIAKPKG